jgi:mono/diheme cytochrome c family protein
MLLACCLACSATSEPDATSRNAPRYHGEVEPILRVQCTGCHRADGAAPFPLDAYALAAERADEIADVTADGRMPPWPAHGGDDCPPLVGTRELDAGAIATLQAWAQAGAPEGTAPRRDQRPEPEPRTDQLDHVDAVLQNAEPYVPLPDVDDHRCFALDPQLDGDRYLTAYAVREGVPGIIHHVQLWAIDDDADEQELDRLDDADPGLGYSCPQGHSLPNARYVSVWAPSDPVRRHPPGTGMLLHAGHRVLIQIHYHDRAALDLPDRTAIELELAERVDLPASMWAVSNGDILLPPGVARSSVIARSSLPAASAVQLWGVRAHMHELGSSAQLNAIDASGAARCLLSIPRWDPAWQLMYFYPTPITLDPSDTLEVDCDYDTRSQTEPVRYGIGTADEMCFGYFYVTEGIPD